MWAYNSTNKSEHWDVLRPTQDLLRTNRHKHEQLVQAFHLMIHNY
jgi:hypothetical protein